MSDLNRRAYLTGVVATAAALAGCPGSGDDTEQLPEPTPAESQPSQPESSESLTAGSPRRRLVSATDRDITIPDDYGTIQEALDQIPLVMRHNWTIDVRAGSYDEDIVVPPFIGEWARPGHSEGVPVQITGNRKQPSNVSVGSVFVTSVFGTIPIQFRGLEITRENPYDDESVGIGVYGSSEVGLVDITFTGGFNGVHAYNSQVMLRNVDFGDGVLDGRGITVKHGGFAYENIDAAEPTSGTVGAIAYNALSGRIWIAGNRSSLSGDTLVQRRGGQVWDYDKQRHVRTQASTTSDQTVQDERIRSDGRLITVSDDDQSTISHIEGGTPGDQCTLVSDGQLTVSQERGNISLAGDSARSLSERETMTVIYDGTEWLEL